MKGKTIAFSGLIVLFGAVPAAQSQDLLIRDNGIFTYHQSPRYRESESHPLRTAAYVFHPVGWVLREAFYRPWSALAGKSEFTRSFFGFREPFDYRDPECFFNALDYPDCRTVPPMSSVGGISSDSGAEEVMDDGGSVAAGERQVFFPDVNFDFDKSSLNDLGKGRVRQISQLLVSVPSLNIAVEGHTDYMGTDEYNQSLGELRAQAVRGELVELGIDPARISSASFGESRPIFAEEEDWARAVNRRVQFSVQGEG